MLFLCTNFIMLRLLSNIILKNMGWKIIGRSEFPDKCIIIAAPHTSNWDFIIARCYGYVVDLSVNYLAKKELFIPFIGFILKINGAIPVDRISANNLVNTIALKFKQNKRFILGLSPEGTRSRVEKWKTGFYYMAIKSEVPILFLKIDYKIKEIGVFNEFYPTGDFEKDMMFIQNEFSSFAGKIPENYNSIIF